ncbi:cobalamin biosynthesis protein, partial [Streptomyces tanashiensis]|uniref:cobalamin biosynthesis protein n=1 Tax=Streptomyces tanashiensis TaxID=67367 RepID=UPI0033D2653D
MLSDGAASAHLGVGARSGAPADEVLALVGAVLREAGLTRADVRSLGTLDARAAEPGIVAPTALSQVQRRAVSELLRVSPVADDLARRFQE